MPIFLGKNVALEGAPLEIGQMAPDFNLLNNDLEERHLSDFPGKKVISVVPSLDTGVCSTQTRRFNQEVAGLDDTTVLTVSVDLPFAQARWCGAQGIQDAITLSDFRSHQFGRDYGVLMSDWQLLSRAVFVLDADNRVVYQEYLDDVHQEPNYQAAMNAVKAI